MIIIIVITAARDCYISSSSL